MRYIKADTFADAYREALDSVLNSPEYETSPRGMKIREVTNMQLEFNPMYPMYDNARRGSQSRYIAAELLWYFTGRNDIDFISKFAKFWEQLDNGDGTVNSAYGNLLFREFNLKGMTEWEWAFGSLAGDRDTRQAVVHFNKPDHKWKGNKDFVCTLNGTFQIRDGKLNFKVHMRSNDMVLGTATDVAFFCLLQQQMLSLLKPTYPNLELGTYVHEVDSMHIYERHFGLVEEMLASEFSRVSFPETDKDLISHSGRPHPKIVRMVESIMEGKEVAAERDPLLAWIANQINTKQ